ncbi:hypothetical protein ACE14D_27455, partial [Streptomyces sp. Act-28]
ASRGRGAGGTRPTRRGGSRPPGSVVAGGTEAVGGGPAGQLPHHLLVRHLVEVLVPETHRAEVRRFGEADQVVHLRAQFRRGPAVAPPAGAAPAVIDVGTDMVDDAFGVVGGLYGGRPGRAATGPVVPKPGRRVLTRVRTTAGELRGRLALALLLGTLALASAVGRMAVSGWLISRASEQPPILHLMVAVTATRAFGIGRAVFRYAERLVSHDAVLRMLADLRVATYQRLERIAPAGLRHTRRGDLLSRLVSDVDALQDYWLRWLLPAGTALLVGVGAVGFTAWLLPEAGAVLAVGLLVAGVAVPALGGAVARRAERPLSLLMISRDDRGAAGAAAVDEAAAAGKDVP